MRAGEIRFAYGPHGKPRLAAGQPDRGLAFNLSHTADHALVAVSRSRVGVDLESIRQLRALDALMERVLAPSEALALRQLSGADRESAFLRAWTRKEAYVKAVGGGIAQGLKRFSVTVSGSRGPLVLDAAGRPLTAWLLRDLAPGPGMVGAVAINAAACELRCWQVQGRPAD